MACFLSFSGFLFFSRFFFLFFFLSIILFCFVAHMLVSVCVCVCVYVCVSARTRVCVYNIVLFYYLITKTLIRPRLGVVGWKYTVIHLTSTVCGHGLGHAFTMHFC